MAQPVPTMHGALAAVAQRFGLGQLLPDANGFAEIVVEEAIPVFLRVADEFELELSARVPEFDANPSWDVLEELMRWNGRFQGMRFAVEPDGGGVVLGRRMDIRVIDPSRLPSEVEDFVIAVADWRRNGAQQAQERVKRHGPGAEVDPIPVFRL